MKRMIFGIIAAILVIITIALLFRPVPIVSENDALVHKGIVKDIFGSSTKDIVFILENNKTRFYINRGTEIGLDAEQLKQELVGKEIVLKYPDYWTPLDWNNKIKHISKVEYENKILFNELK